tara:strand:+ start:600 stop:992 length:393 start_codon:yes stop_codon:yes gene_type:complete
MESYRHAAGCVVFNDNKVLLLRRSIHETSQHGLYELPGGKVEGAESPQETAIIETKEEAGIDVIIYHELDIHIDKDMEKVYHGFIATVEGDSAIVLSEEHDEYCWMTIDEALSMDSPLSHHARFLFEQLI